MNKVFLFLSLCYLSLSDHFLLEQKEKALQAQYDQEFDEYQKNLELAIRNREDIQAEFIQLQEETNNQDKLLHEQIQQLAKQLQKQSEQFQQEKCQLNEQIQAQEERLKEYESTLDQTSKLYQEVIRLSFSRRSIHPFLLQIETLGQANGKLKKDLEDLRNAHDPKEIESLTQEITDLQQMNTNLIQKQVEKQQEYEMKVAMLKSKILFNDVH